MILLELPLPPDLGRYWQEFGWNRARLSGEGRAYRASVIAALPYGSRILRGPVTVVATFHQPDDRRPMEMATLLEALRGTLYVSAAQVVRAVAERTHAERPRVEVRLYPTSANAVLRDPPPGLEALCQTF